MQIPAMPPDEQGRLRALHTYGVLDTLEDPAFDAITRLAAHILDVPIALVSIVDADRQWFKSHFGLEVAETPRDISFCGHVVASGRPLLVPDAALDERFFDNPLVIDEPKIVFYLGLPLTDGQGHVLGTLCVVDHRPREVSARQRELLELLVSQTMGALELHRRNRVLVEEKARNEAYRRFFELSPDLLCTADPAMRFRKLSPGWERSLGWTLDELRSRSAIEFLHPEDRLRVLNPDPKDVDQVSNTLRMETRMMHKDGRALPFSWVSVFSDGVFYASARDISEHHRLLSNLTEGELRLRSIIDTAADAILAVDGAGQVERANPAVERMFGYAPQELVGQHLRTLMPAADLAWLDSPPLGPSERSGKGREVLGRCKDGTSFPVELAETEFQVEGVRRFTVVLRDVTERAQADQLKRELISTVSHELRTPLTSIRGSLGLVAAGITGELPPLAAEYVGMALAGCERLVRLVNDMLDLDKMAAGRLELHMGAVDLREACRRAIATTEAQASLLGVTVKLCGEEPDRWVWADEDRVAQVMSNLLSNAVKFSPADTHVCVSVAVRGSRARVGVRDFGPGIAEGFRGRIFQRFAQADGSDARASGGSGLGLAISKAIIEAMGGEIGFQDAEGGGTEFYFELEQVPAPPRAR